MVGYKPSGKAKFLYLPKVGIRAVQTLSRTKQNTKNIMFTILFLDCGAAKYKAIQYFILSYIDNQFNSCRKDNIEQSYLSQIIVSNHFCNLNSLSVWWSLEYPNVVLQ